MKLGTVQYTDQLQLWKFLKKSIYEFWLFICFYKLQEESD